MKTAMTFEAAVRENQGKGASRELRRNGRLPAVIYGNGQTPVSFSIDMNAFHVFMRKGGVSNKLLDIKLGGKTYHALAREIQLHPVSDQPLHVDFFNVDENSRIHVFVPVIIENAERCIGIKRGGALNVVRHEVELICKPDAIPSAIRLDISDMKIGASLHISSVNLPENVEPAIKDRDFTLVTVAGRGGKEEEGDAQAAAAAAPAAGAKAAAKPAAAAAKPAAKPAAKK